MTVSVIIPSFDGSRSGILSHLLEDLQTQTLPPIEVEIVRGESPNGHARNVGAAKTSGDILVFLDDDVRLGSPHILRSFVDHLCADSSLAMVGTSQLLPPDSTAFQRRCARQISRSESPVVDVLTESDMVTTQCCAMRRELLEMVGGFHGKIHRGVDPELRFRVRRAGYRIAVVPNAWHYHPMPSSLKTLLRMAWRNGAASAYARKRFPETVLFNPEGHVAEFDAHQSLSQRAIGKLWSISSDAFTGRWYGLLYGLCYSAAVVYPASKDPCL